MTFDDFQTMAKRTSAVPWDERPGERLLVQTLGLCGEAGELADLVKETGLARLRLDAGAHRR